MSPKGWHVIEARPRRVGVHAETVRWLRATVRDHPDDRIVVVTTQPERWERLAKNLGISVVSPEPEPRQRPDIGRMAPGSELVGDPELADEVDMAARSSARRLEEMLLDLDRDYLVDRGRMREKDMDEKWPIEYPT